MTMSTQQRDFSKSPGELWEHFGVLALRIGCLEDWTYILGGHQYVLAKAGRDPLMVLKTSYEWPIRSLDRSPRESLA